MIREDENIIGFVIVRLQEFCERIASWSAYPPLPMPDGALYYGGVDRMRWHDIGDDFYEGKLPPHIKQLYDAVNRNSDFTGISLCKDIREAQILLEYSNRNHVVNEIIAIRSQALTKVKGSIRANSINIEWLGIDILSLGYWSLLHDGLFRKPAAFTEWQQYLTPFGLMSDASIMRAYAHAYETAAENGNVEPLPVSGIYTDGELDVGLIYAVEVGRIQAQNPD